MGGGGWGGGGRGVGGAEGELGEGTEAKGTLDVWFGRFRNGPLTAEATLLLGRVNEGLKNVEGAIAAYREVAGRYGGGIGERAKKALQRLEPKPANEPATARRQAQDGQVERGRLGRRG